MKSQIYFLKKQTMNTAMTDIPETQKKQYETQLQNQRKHYEREIEQLKELLQKQREQLDEINTFRYYQTMKWRRRGDPFLGYFQI
jgi:hypothetical protein